MRPGKRKMNILRAFRKINKLFKRLKTWAGSDYSRVTYKAEQQ